MRSTCLFGLFSRARAVFSWTRSYTRAHRFIRSFAAHRSRIMADLLPAVLEHSKNDTGSDRPVPTIERNGAPSRQFYYCFCATVRHARRVTATRGMRPNKNGSEEHRQRGLAPRHKRHPRWRLLNYRAASPLGRVVVFFLFSFFFSFFFPPGSSRGNKSSRNSD